MYWKQNQIQGCLKSYVTETGFYCGLKSRWQVHCERVVLSMYQHCPFLPIKISLHSQKKRINCNCFFFFENACSHCFSLMLFNCHKYSSFCRYKYPYSGSCRRRIRSNCFIVRRPTCCAGRLNTIHQCFA